MGFKDEPKERSIVANKPQPKNTPRLKSKPYNSNIEEALELMEHMLNAYCELQSDNLTTYETRLLFKNNYILFNTIKQSLLDKDNEITLLKRNLDSRDTMRKLTVDKLQSQLDKIDKVVKDYDINDVYKAQDYMQLIISILRSEDNE